VIIRIESVTTKIASNGGGEEKGRNTISVFQSGSLLAKEGPRLKEGHRFYKSNQTGSHPSRNTEKSRREGWNAILKIGSRAKKGGCWINTF